MMLTADPVRSEAPIMTRVELSASGDGGQMLRMTPCPIASRGTTTATSLGVGYIGAVMNNPLQLPLTGLATFVSTVFLQTGLDVTVVVALLAIGNGVILRI